MSGQVLPDFAGFTPPTVACLKDAEDHLSLEEWAQITEAKENQSSCIRRFLDLEEGDEVSAPTLYRRATWKVLKGLDHALKLTTSRGLEAWCQKQKGLDLLAEPARAIASQYVSPVPRVLTVVADQAGSGVSALAFLANHLGPTTILMMDPPTASGTQRSWGYCRGMGGRWWPSCLWFSISTTDRGALPVG